MPYGLRVKGKSYLDWVLKALARHRSMTPFYKRYHLSVYPFNDMYDREPDFTVRQISSLELVLDEAQLRTEEMLKRENYFCGTARKSMMKMARTFPRQFFL